MNQTAFSDYLLTLLDNTPFLIVLALLCVVPLLTVVLHKLRYQKQHQSLEQSYQTQHIEDQQELANANQTLALAHNEKSQLEEKYQALLKEKQHSLDEAVQQAKELQDSLQTKQQQIGVLLQKEAQLDALESKYQTCIDENRQLERRLNEVASSLDAKSAAFEQERAAFEEKLGLLKNAEQQLVTQFENLANKIFEQKSEKFTQNSQTGINQLLSPLKSQIDDFKKQISDQYLKEGQERAALKNEILGLKELNLQITQEASALTNALKGDNKQQGNWGEVVLSKILDESGLREGREYEVQKSLNSEDGKRYRPDIVVHLPNQKDIVIDSKVSLLAHEKVVNANNDEERVQALKEHVNSVKGHIKGLSKKDYQDLEGVNTLDYVLMFIPIETAFLNAVDAEPSLIKLALDNQIMLVSPTNLLVALRTINNIWQYEYQNQNAKLIADKARKMYEKFASFVEDMEKIGKNIETLNKNYDASMNKLSSGRGNLMRQAEGFKDLGVTPNKSIGQEWLTSDED